MNVSKNIITLFLLMITLVSCKKNEPKKNLGATTTETKKPIAANAKIEIASFTIDGMTCAIGCAKTIEQKLNETEGVQNAKVSFEKKSGIISFDSAIQNPDKLKKIVESVADGTTYKVSKMKS